MAEFILKNSKGKEQTFNQDKIFVQGTDGELVQFTEGTGSSADVRYVTFMSYDGLTEYGKKAVAVGDDCADPIARGIFGTPTRESDVQYNYTFSGWATEANGAINSNWNKAITEDKVVYATFNGDVRYYTITYYDEDGSTVLKTESLAYGATPSYMPEKSGYSFEEWIPELTTVTNDATYVAQWEEKITFAGGSLEDIVEVSERGDAKDYFAVGDKKTVTIGDTNIDLMIIGFDHDEKSDGTGKAGMTILMLTPFSNTTINDNLTTTVRNFCKNTLVPQLPEVLRNAIKPVNKNTNTFGTVSTDEWHAFPLSFTDMKVKAHGGYNSSKGTWQPNFEDGGTPYKYFADNYYSNYYGPALAWTKLSNINDTWIRNHYLDGTTKKNLDGLYPYYATTTAKTFKYADSVTYDSTTKKPILLAFCI